MKNRNRPQKPEELSGYIQTASVPSWLILIVTLLLFVIGFLFVVSKGLNERMTAAAFCKNGEMDVYIGEEDLDEVKGGMKLEVENNVYYVTDIEPADEHFTVEEHTFIINKSRVKEGELLYRFTLNTNMADGRYTANILTGKSGGEELWEYLTR